MLTVYEKTTLGGTLKKCTGALMSEEESLAGSSSSSLNFYCPGRHPSGQFDFRKQRVENSRKITSASSKETVRERRNSLKE